MSGRDDFQDRCGIVTGAASGIGLAAARLLCQRGGRTAMVDIDVDKLRQEKEQIQKLGGQAVAIPADVAREEDVARLVQETLGAFGSVDFLVNCAGILRPTPALQLEPAEWDRVLSVNLRGPYLCCRAVLSHMIARKRGVIVNVSSQAGRSTSRLGGIHYTASKAGLIGLTRQLALEVGPHGIRVNALCPGGTLTPMVTSLLTPEIMAERSARIPLRRYSTPEEQAMVIAFLLSDESSFITGASIDANGGIYML